jgi:hypothetical protein
MRQVLRDESTELYARVQLSAVCRVVADRLSAAADEAARGATGGRPGRVPFEHLVAIAGDLDAAEERMLPTMRKENVDMLSRNREEAQAAIERGLVAALTAGSVGASSERSKAEPTLHQTEKEVRAFTRDYLRLLELRLVTVPRLGGGPRASDVVAAMPARTQAYGEYLAPLRYTAPVKLSLRRLLERDQAQREAAAASRGTAPPAFNALLAVLVLLIAGMVYWTGYICPKSFLVRIRLLPAPAWEPLAQIALHLFATAWSAGLLWQLPSYPIWLGLLQVGEGAASSPHGSLCRRLRASHSNIVRLKLYSLVATMRRLPQPLERELSSVQSACEVQFCVWLRRLALAWMREAVHRKSIGAHEARMLFLDLHEAAQVSAQAGGSARAGVSRKSRVHHPQAPRPKAHQAPGAGASGGREAFEEAGGSSGDAGRSPSPGCEGVEFELPGTDAEVEAFLMLPVVEDTEGEADERSAARLLSGSVGRGAALLGKGGGTWKAARPRLGYAGGAGGGGGEEAGGDGAGGSERGGGEGGAGGGGRGGRGSGESESGPPPQLRGPGALARARGGQSPPAGDRLVDEGRLDVRPRSEAPHLQTDRLDRPSPDLHDGVHAVRLSGAPRPDGDAAQARRRGRRGSLGGRGGKSRRRRGF